MVYVSFFSGIGGWDLGAYWAGIRFDAHYYSDIDKYCNKVMSLRFPDAVALGDINGIHGAELKARHPGQDFVFTGSFPCVSISAAGKRTGIHGKESDLWFEYLRLIKEMHPAAAMVENVGDLSMRGLDTVVAGFAEAGYDCEWRLISASCVGAPHLRNRLWIVAYPSDVCNKYLMSFRLNVRRDLGSGESVMGLQDAVYMEAYFVGHACNGGVWSLPGGRGKSVGRNMPKGGYARRGEVYDMPAWEHGLEVRYEDVANADVSRQEECSHTDIKESAVRGPVLGCKEFAELEGAWDVKPGVQRMVDGVSWSVGCRGREVPFPVITEKVPDITNQLSCYGNAVLPQIAWVMWRRAVPLLGDCVAGE